jgi:hypothetical protein
VSEESLLRVIFGLKRNEVMGGWRKMCIKDLCDLYTSPGKHDQEVDEMGGACSMNWETKKEECI